MQFKRIFFKIEKQTYKKKRNEMRLKKHFSKRRLCYGRQRTVNSSIERTKMKKKKVQSESGLQLSPDKLHGTKVIGIPLQSLLIMNTFHSIIKTGLLTLFSLPFLILSSYLCLKLHIYGSNEIRRKQTF